MRPPYLLTIAEGAILKLVILASAVSVGAIVWSRTREPARATAYGVAVALVILAFIFFLMLLSAG